MSKDLAAIGRSVGKVDTDSGGLARYSFKLQVAPGTRHGAEPELSLEYCQAGPNGSLGTGWALGGISCIRKGPSNLAFDGINPAPQNYDTTQAKLHLDGVQLLNIEGQYLSSDAKYTTEVDQSGRVVASLGAGFVVTDSAGSRSEYGTSDDSCIRGLDKSPREWRLKRMSDYHGNTITYNYVSSPRSSSDDVNTCYLSTIRYTSNTRTNYEGNRIIKFDYSSRPDLIVQNLRGTKSVWASRLSSISFGVIQNDETTSNRSYELSYSISPSTGDSCLVAITETGMSGAGKISLLPSEFSYSALSMPIQDLYKSPSQQTFKLSATTNNVALFSMNISGRCLSDIACIRYDQRIKQMSIKTYLAVREDNKTISWTPSTDTGAVATLPPMDLSKGFPSILTPDLNRDGRADFVVPYKDNDGYLRFSISQGVGTGFKDAQSKRTTLKWIDGCKFITVENPDRGPSIVQVATDKNKLTFTNFPGFVQDGTVGLKDAIVTSTSYENVGTIDWVQLAQSDTGARSLVRVWAADLGMGRTQLKATAFNIGADEKLKEGATSLLGPPSKSTKVKYSVITCDVNADGAQDILLAAADYSSGKMTLTISIYLGDGTGAFIAHGDPFVRDVVSPVPMKPVDFGQFYVTNLNGSNYPSLSYVYQARNNRAFSCITIDGRSDGSLSNPTLHELARDFSSVDTEVLAVDLDGNSMGDWLFYTLANDTPLVTPVYNRASPVDFLTRTRDPMGLETKITYGAISNPTNYLAGVDWKNFNNTSTDSYPVLAAPNYVVTALDHRNDPAITSIPYQASVKKQYARARVNTLGRGWQGFDEIITTNVTDNLVTSELYTQSWPLTNTKREVNTKTIDGTVLKSVKTSSVSTFKSRGAWKIYRVSNASEQTDMIEGGNIVRSNGTRFEYDDAGNQILQAPYEVQNGKLVFQSWKRCVYKTIDGVTGVLLGEKISGNASNTDITKFEQGDLSFKLYENETDRAVLRTVLTWSTDVGGFSKKSYKFDQYGREIQSIDAAGLTKTIQYDALFQTFPVKITETGAGVSTTQLMAYDIHSGYEVARQEVNGLLDCYKVDCFGRTTDTRSRANVSCPSSLIGTDFLADFISDPSLREILSRSFLNPQRRITFERSNSLSGKAHIGSRVVTYTKDGIEGEHELVEYVNCVKQACKRSSRNGSDSDKVWVHWKYTAAGQAVFESFPARLSDGLDWEPNERAGISLTVDALGRITTRVRPSHGTQTGWIATTMTYLDGGARIKESTCSSESSSPPFMEATRTPSSERRAIAVGKEERVIEYLDENGLRSILEYDALGRLVKCTDPAGQIETRTYNSMGELLTMDNVYQNGTDSRATPAMRQRYNIAGHVVEEINSAGEIVRYERDAKGRMLLKIGQDGRTVKFSYDTSIEALSSITVHANGQGATFDSQLLFKYDDNGRVVQRSLTLANGSTHKVSFIYDWQGQLIQKLLPGGVNLDWTYNGSDTVLNKLSGGSSNWTLQSEILKSSPYGRPEVLKVQGSGIQTFLNNWQYDAHGFPTSHSLGVEGKSLVDERYIYNSMDQLSRKHDFIKGQTTDYSYQGKRLSSTQLGSGQNHVYAFDAAGNLSQRRDTKLIYSAGRVKGSVGDKTTFEALYDNAGRTVQRTTPESHLMLSYDTFGSLKNISDDKGQSVTLLSDHNGEMMQREHSDGSSDLYIDDDVSIHVQTDGSKIIRYYLYNQNEADNKKQIVATMSTAYESVQSQRPLSAIRKVSIQFANTKNNVSHTFKGDDASLQSQIDYDDFGYFDTKDTVDDEHKQTTFEGTLFDDLSGLMNFGSRWYDPLVGRFIVPDDIMDVASLIRPDGTNRYAFECNDPINNTDPTGHWTWSAVLGVVLSVVLIVAAVALTVATGGAAGILMGAAVGALASGGIAGLFYSIKHQDEDDAGKFWGGFFTTVALNAAIGAVAGAAGAVAAPARMASMAARLAAKAFIGGATSVLGKAAERGVDNLFYGTHHNLFEGWASNFAIGAAVGLVCGSFGERKPSVSSPNKLPGINKFEGSFKLRSFTGVRAILEPKPTNPWADLTKETAKFTLKEVLKPGGKIAVWGAKELGLDKKLNPFQ